MLGLLYGNPSYNLNTSRPMVLRHVVPAVMHLISCGIGIPIPICVQSRTRSNPCRCKVVRPMAHVRSHSSGRVADRAHHLPAQALQGRVFSGRILYNSAANRLP
ncbi:hypothetical protein MLD38_034662 [Melastoma candidum]|uniref:Uncharacterized protein n=1 Tax=Melastoma candidum TaxID=119954 RepID=A0ACB9MB67_9MYRT|nr:hypothetical protein MLD38_034662 [Melastoma candidum]